MKKYFFLILLLVGLMACSTAPPPMSETANVFSDEILNSDNFVNCNAELQYQVREVPNSPGDLVISVDNLTGTENLYASLSTGYQEEPAQANETINNSLGFFQEHWIALLIGLLAFAKVVVNLTPSEKDNKIFGWLDSIINYIIPNLKKGGGTHATPG